MATTADRPATQTKAPRVVVIVGLPGVGKSTVGRRTARKIGWDFLDLDSAIESRAGRTVREIFEAEGETGFRDIENSTLVDRLQTSTSCIVATGGGIVLRKANREALSTAGAVIWMKADVDDLAERLGPRTGTGRGHRPLLDGNLNDNLRRLTEERSSLYAEVATDVLETSGKGFDEVVDALVEIIVTRGSSTLDTVRDDQQRTQHAESGSLPDQRSEG